MYLWTRLREKCPNTDIVVVRIFMHLDWIRRDTSYLPVFSPNAGKYGQEKTPYLDKFHTADQADLHFLIPNLEWNSSSALQ